MTDNTQELDELNDILVSFKTGQINIRIAAHRITKLLDLDQATETKLNIHKEDWNNI